MKSTLCVGCKGCTTVSFVVSHLHMDRNMSLKVHTIIFLISFTKQDQEIKTELLISVIYLMNCYQL